MFASFFKPGTLRMVARSCLPESSFCQTTSAGNQRITGRDQSRRSFNTSGVSRDRTDEERRKQLESNPYYAKYAKKLEDADLSRLDNVKEEPRSNIFKQAMGENSKREPSGRLTAESNPEMKPLESIMKMELLQDLTGEEIGALWQKHHADQSCIGAVVPAAVYHTLKQRATECPLFLLPVPRAEGVEFFYQQFRGNQIAFTSLLEYKTHSENARPYLLLNHYVELLESKGVVLMAGDLDDNINVMDAQFLANQVQLYYLGDAEAYDVVKQFNHRPEEFDYNTLLTRLDTLVQGQAAELEKEQ
eukprot:m.118332 g.118332  ORF g.118332 m.118332 type:complete len:303 (+) comp17203_c0_seq1:199-1107(+)